MRNPIDGESRPFRTFDPAKRYRYTWPGQTPRVVSGEELAAICRGANHEMLDISESTSAPAAAETKPRLP